MSSAWIQCSESRVVARVRGFSGVAAHEMPAPGSASPSASSARRRATFHLSKIAVDYIAPEGSQHLLEALLLHLESMDNVIGRPVDQPFA